MAHRKMLDKQKVEYDFLDFCSIAAEAWNKLPPRRKRIYEEMSRKDGIRAKRDREKWIGAIAE